MIIWGYTLRFHQFHGNGKSPNGSCFSWENHWFLWSVFQHAVFDYQRVDPLILGGRNVEFGVVSFHGLFVFEKETWNIHGISQLAWWLRSIPDKTRYQKCVNFLEVPQKGRSLASFQWLSCQQRLTFSTASAWNASNPRARPSDPWRNIEFPTHKVSLGIRQGWTCMGHMLDMGTYLNVRVFTHVN